METLALPGVGERVGRVALGTWSMGGWMWGEHADTRLAARTVDEALDVGIRVIDTAPVYGFGLSETVVGEVLERRGLRDEVVIATKCGLGWDAAGVTHRDSSPSTIRREVEESLRRLRTDRVDILQVHWPDPSVPTERTAEAMRALLEEGKVRALGVCNYSTAEMDRFRAAAPLVSCQSRYNLLERSAEEELVPYCRRNGLAFLAYSPLARGLLAGKMRQDREPDDKARRAEMFHGEEYVRNLARVRSLDGFARERYGREVVHLAARWVLDKVERSMVLWGARTPEQLTAVGGVWGWSLDAASISEVEALAGAW